MTVPERKTSSFEYKFVENGNLLGTFEGYGSVFNNEDDGGDLVMPGAFQKTLDAHKTARTMPKMLLNHGNMGSLFGGGDPMANLPIGKWTKMSEDSRGLQVKGRLINLDGDRGKTIYGAMKEGELNGLSIGYIARDFVRGTKPNETRRTLKSVDLLEVSLVTFPMNKLAGIDAIKHAGDITTIREFEAFLVESGNYSRETAKAIAERGFSAFMSEPWDEDGASEKVITGLATSYRELHLFKGQYDLFGENCFDCGLSVRAQHPVAFQLDHDPATKMGSTEDRLELFSNSDGLWFRFFPSASAKHQSVVAAIAKNGGAAVSVASAPLREGYITMHGIDVRIIHEAFLAEISLSLSRPGAVMSAAAILVDAAGLRPLSEEVKAGSLDVIRSRMRCDVSW